jgi:hypothetical protein
MQTVVHHSPEVAQAGTIGFVFTPLSLETRAVLDTEAAAYHLNRRPQTLRCWAAYENGPIRPLRVNGRLAWSVADLRKLLGVA